MRGRPPRWYSTSVPPGSRPWDWPGPPESRPPWSAPPVRQPPTTCRPWWRPTGVALPLVVITADRPPGFLDRDAPQTINQVGLYGSAVRSAAYLPVAHECDPEWVAGEVLRVLGTAYPPDAGPVHLNVPFDKPLEPPPRRATKPSFEISLPESGGEGVRGSSVEKLGGFMDRAAPGPDRGGSQSDGSDRTGRRPSIGGAIRMAGPGRRNVGAAKL